MFILLFAGCEKDGISQFENEPLELNSPDLKAHSEKVNTFYGPAQPFGNGVVRAMVTMNREGEPQAIAVIISEKALERMPEEMRVITLKLPNKAEGLAFDHIDLDWNPAGHEPPGMYDLPHFDFHFYMISEEEKMKMTDWDVEVMLPSQEFWPENYFPTQELVPSMGMHWLNSLAPELGGETFTHTFIYGSYGGQFIFYEPMVTVDYLKQANGESFTIHQPEEFQREGYYYPTTYSISHDPVKKEYLISLEGMVLR